MTLTLREYLDFVAEEYQGFLDRPMSRRRARACAVLIDNLPDRVFMAHQVDNPQRVFHAQDLPAYRKIVLAECPEAQLLSDLCALQDGGPRLVYQAMPVARADETKIDISDFMVHLYNDMSVETVTIRRPGAADLRFAECAGAAVTWWQDQFKTKNL